MFLILYEKIKARINVLYNNSCFVLMNIWFCIFRRYKILVFQLWERVHWKVQHGYELSVRFQYALLFTIILWPHIGSCHATALFSNIVSLTLGSHVIKSASGKWSWRIWIKQTGTKQYIFTRHSQAGNVGDWLYDRCIRMRFCHFPSRKLPLVKSWWFTGRLYS